MSEITLSSKEVEALTGYTSATKQLNVLRSRGFVRAFINRRGDVVVERAHYEAVSRGEMYHHYGLPTPEKVANLSHFNNKRP